MKEAKNQNLLTSTLKGAIFGALLSILAAPVAHAADLMMGEDNDASWAATTLQSDDAVNTMLIQNLHSATNAGIAVDLINDGYTLNKNTGNAIHAWSSGSAGYGVYAEDAGMSGEAAGIKASTAEFETAYTGRGAMNLEQQANAIVNSPCFTANSNVGMTVSPSGELLICAGASGWKRVYLQ